MPDSPDPMRARVLIVHFAFLLTGVVTTMLGPLLPDVAAHWHLNDVQAGRLFLAQFLGGFVGSLLAGQVMARWNARLAVIAGLLLGGIGVATLWMGSLPLAMLSLFCYGGGMGLTAPATNILVTQMVTERRAAALNLLNFSWTAGALMTPALLAFLLAHARVQSVMTTLALLLVSFAVFISAQRVHVTSSIGHTPGSIRYMPPIAMATAVLMFLYVGVENSVAGWLPSYSLRTFPLGQHMGAAVQTTFWAALLAGRLSAPLALRKLRPVPLVQTGIMVALVGIGLIVLVPLRTATFAGAAVAGAGLAVILPTAVAVIVDKLGSAAHAITGVLFAFAGLGGATLPATVGYISGHTGSLRLGLASSIFATLTMLVCQLWISRWANTPHAISASAA